MMYTFLGFEMYSSYVAILFYRQKQQDNNTLYKIENYKNKIIQILKIISKCYPLYFNAKNSIINKNNLLSKQIEKEKINLMKGGNKIGQEKINFMKGENNKFFRNQLY